MIEWQIVVILSYPIRNECQSVFEPPAKDISEAPHGKSPRYLPETNSALFLQSSLFACRHHTAWNSGGMSGARREHFRDQ